MIDLESEDDDVVDGVEGGDGHYRNVIVMFKLVVRPKTNDPSTKCCPWGKR